SEDQDMGLRVFVGKKQAIVSTSDFTNRAALEELAQRAVAMAKVVPEDPFTGLADPSEIDKNPPQLEILDPKEPSEAELIALVREAEAAARAVKGVTNSEGAEAGWGAFGIGDALDRTGRGFRFAHQGDQFRLARFLGIEDLELRRVLVDLR